MDNYNLASLCYNWIERYEKATKERDQAIKERDALKKQIGNAVILSGVIADRDEARREVQEHRRHVSKLMKDRSEARYWARKMMAERDEWKKRYDGLRVHQLETTLRTKDGWEFFVDDGVLWGRKK
jgi:uncharacterized coiled-coil DUF342 family protein